MNHQFEELPRFEGLLYCSVCGLLEGSLTTDCPGVKSWSEHGDDIYSGKKDFRDGRWVNLPSPYSPQSART